MEQYQLIKCKSRTNLFQIGYITIGIITVLAFFSPSTRADETASSPQELSRKLRACVITSLKSGNFMTNPKYVIQMQVDIIRRKIVLSCVQEVVAVAKSNPSGSLDAELPVEIMNEEIRAYISAPTESIQNDSDADYDYR